MIVVSNTSPFTNLAAIRQFDLLRSLFGEIHIADGVWHELNAGGQPHPGSVEVDAASWVRRHTVANQTLVAALRRDLDLGEAETLALAVELGAEIVLIDEREGRHVARRLELQPLGVLGVLLQAKRAGRCEKIRPLLEALRRQAGFYIAGDLYRYVLEQADETDDE